MFDTELTARLGDSLSAIVSVDLDCNGILTATVSTEVETVSAQLQAERISVGKIHQMIAEATGSAFIVPAVIYVPVIAWRESNLGMMLTNLPLHSDEAWLADHLTGLTEVYLLRGPLSQSLGTCYLVFGTPDQLVRAFFVARFALQLEVHPTDATHIENAEVQFYSTARELLTRSDFSGPQWANCLGISLDALQQIDLVTLSDTLRSLLFQRAPGNHRLQSFLTPTSGFLCDLCSREQCEGVTMFGSREENYDVCQECMRSRSHISDSARVFLAVHSANFDPRSGTLLPVPIRQPKLLCCETSPCEKMSYSVAEVYGDAYAKLFSSR